LITFKLPAYQLLLKSAFGDIVQIQNWKIWYTFTSEIRIEIHIWFKSIIFTFQ